MAVYTEYSDSYMLAFPSESPEIYQEAINGLCFLQQQQQQQRISPLLPLTCNQILAAFFEKQKQEIDQFITLQGERLRLELEAQRREHLQAILRRASAKASALIGERDARIEEERRRGAELQEMLRRAETERAAWQRLACEKEAAATTLAIALERLGGSPPGGDEDDAESRCIGSSSPAGSSSPSPVSPCRACGSSDARVIILPCRHLCACGTCGESVRTCPVCGSTKRASVEVFFM